MLDLSQVKAKLDEIDGVLKQLNQFILAALPTMGPDCLKLAMAVSAMVASGGADGPAIIAAIADLHQINTDFLAAKAAVKAQQETSPQQG